MYVCVYVCMCVCVCMYVIANKRTKNEIKPGVKLHHIKHYQKGKAEGGRRSKRTGENAAKTSTIKTEVNTRQYM